MNNKDSLENNAELFNNILTAVVLATVGKLVPSWLDDPKVRTAANVALVGTICYVVFTKARRVYSDREMKT